MPLFEFYCETCKAKFEQITSSSETVKCPKCKGQKIQKLISLFRVGGRGDLRETTQHGCHDHYTGLEGGHSHDEGE